MAAQNTIIAIPAIIGFFLVVAALLQWLWNTTMPEVFRLRSITYWPAFRLMLIAGLLFSGPMIIR